MQGAWLTGYLGMIGQHLPAKFPKTPEELLPKKAETKQATPTQWAALFSHVLGKPVKIDRPQEE